MHLIVVSNREWHRLYICSTSRLQQTDSWAKTSLTWRGIGDNQLVAHRLTLLVPAPQMHFFFESRRFGVGADKLGLETARDLGREFRHAYPELVDEFL